MSLEAGTQLGRYEIRSRLGAGGMGEVYLAQDTKLDRKVALKILPPDLAANQDRMRRFVQEAKSAAALNHPNIAHIYEIGEDGGTNFISMEYVDGATLREKIHRERTPLGKLLKYLTQVAEGLTKAHQAGIVHRDLKPDNIMVTRDGYAKILDFGLAKLVEPQKSAGDQAMSEVATALMPQHSTPGMVMGTIGYMSPEQAQGKVQEIDQRSDIFSFGCILYEAATGRKAFEGKDVLDSLHKIVHAATPQIKEINANAPDELQRIVRRCLAKDPERRYQSIKDVAIELEELQQELKGETESDRTIQPEVSSEAVANSNPQSATRTSQTSGASLTAPAESRPTSSAEYVVSAIKRHRRGAAIILAAVVLAIAGVALILYKSAGQNGAKSAVPFQVGKVDRLTNIGKALDAAVSPDGKLVVYVLSDAGQQSLWVRDVATNSNVQIVPPAEILYHGLTFSPDGNYVFYVRAEKGDSWLMGTLYQVPKLGGTPKKLLSDVYSPVTLSPDGRRLAFVRSAAEEDALIVANADGTGEQTLATLHAPEAFSAGGTTWSVVHGAPAWSPDGKVIACPATVKDDREVRGLRATVVAVSVADGNVKAIASEKLNKVERVAWLHDGSGLVMINTADYNSQIQYLSYPGGEAQSITHDLNQYVDVSLTADSNALVAVQVEPVSNVWVAAPGQGAANARQITNGKLDGYCGLSWTPDGHVVYASRKIRDADLWVMNADGSNQKQLMDDVYLDRFPSVTPDGRYIVFDSWRGGNVAHIWRMDIDGGNMKQLTSGSGDAIPHCSPDGKWVAYTSSGPSIWKVSIDGGQPIRLTDKLTTRPAFSPDGKLIACTYRPDRNSPWRIAVIPSEGGQPIKIFETPVPISNFPVLRWTADGRAILYADEHSGVGNIWSQPVDGGKPVQVTDFKSDFINTFDLSRDGRQLVVARGTLISDIVMMSTPR